MGPLLVPWASVVDSPWWSRVEEAAWVLHLRKTQLRNYSNLETVEFNPHGFSRGWGALVAEGKLLQKSQYNCSDACGIKFQAVMAGPERSTDVFAKIVLTYPHQDSQGESHLREVMAYALDRVIGTASVMPCVGRVMSPPLSAPPSIEKTLMEASRCVRHPGRGFELAISMKAPGVFATNHIHSLDTKEGWSKYRYSEGYRMFNFAAGCFRSAHNNFIFSPPQSINEGVDPSWVSIDHDRCFMDENLVLNVTKNFKDNKRFFSPPDCEMLRAGAHWNIWKYQSSEDIISAFLDELKADDLWPEMLLYMYSGSILPQLRARLGILYVLGQTCTNLSQPHSPHAPHSPATLPHAPSALLPPPLELPPPPLPSPPPPI